MNHLQPWKSRKSPVQSHPFTPSLQGQRGMVGIGDQISTGITISAETGKESPVLFTGSQDFHAFQSAERLHKIKSQWQGSRLFEDLWMSDHPKTSAKNQLRHSYTLRFNQCRFKPLLDFQVAVTVLPVRMNQDIDIEEPHSPVIIRLGIHHLEQLSRRVEANALPQARPLEGGKDRALRLPSGLGSRDQGRPEGLFDYLPER